jgi:hypothetical protein
MLLLLLLLSRSKPRKTCDDGGSVGLNHELRLLLSLWLRVSLCFPQNAMRPVFAICLLSIPLLERFQYVNAPLSVSQDDYFLSRAKINSLARSATATIPNIGFVVKASVMEESTTCKLSMPNTLVFESTQAPILQLPLQWLT